MYSHSEYQRRLRLAVFTAYGGAFCVLCGETRFDALAIDHVNGGGKRHRKKLGGGFGVYVWLKRSGFPNGFRILCANCNITEHRRTVPNPGTPSAASLRKTVLNIKRRVFTRLGLACAVCGIDDLSVLTVHHKLGNGNEHRKALS